MCVKTENKGFLHSGFEVFCLYSACSFLRVSGWNELTVGETEIDLSLVRRFSFIHLKLRFLIYVRLPNDWTRFSACSRVLIIHTPHLLHSTLFHTPRSVLCTSHFPPNQCRFIFRAGGLKLLDDDRISLAAIFDFML